MPHARQQSHESWSIHCRMTSRARGHLWRNDIDPLQCRMVRMTIKELRHITCIWKHQHKCTPENYWHGPWKSHVFWEGKSSSKPPFLGSILIFGADWSINTNNQQGTTIALGICWKERYHHQWLSLCSCASKCLRFHARKCAGSYFEGHRKPWKKRGELSMGSSKTLLPLSLLPIRK